MKKVISLVLSVVMVLSMVSVFADASINVTIDGKVQNYDVMPVIENGRTLVPMRGIFEALGAEINWDDASKTVTGTKGETKIILQIGNTVAKVNDEDTTLDVAATIVEGRTMVPARFISESLGCKVGWDDATKTVIISTSTESKGNLAELKSDFHRPIPTQFEKSSSYDDIIHFESISIEDQEAAYAELKKDGTLVCSTEDFFNELKPVKKDAVQYGSYKVIDVEGQAFQKALQITCDEVPEKDSTFIVYTDATPEKEKGAGISAKEKMLMAFRLRLVEGGDGNGNGKIKIQVQHPETYKKAIFKEIPATKDWTIIYLPFYGKEDATDIGIRPGYYKQVIEIGGIEILNFGEDYDVTKFPDSTKVDFEDLKPDAKWRKEAFKRIDEIRKGDFTVIAKDENGNVIPDAEVKLDMFEHEFLFGTAVAGTFTNTSDEKYSSLREKFSENFNSVVNTTNFKWQNLIKRPGYAQNELKTAQELGAKYIRGHMLFCEQGIGGNEANRFPDYMCEDNVMADKELFLKLCEEHVADVAEKFKDFDIEYIDVLNEILMHAIQSDHFGDDIWVNFYNYARKYFPDAKLFYNENDGVLTEKYIELMDRFVELGIDFDGLGIQSHYDGDFYVPSEQVKLYETLRNRYGKELQVTEYSCSVTDTALQGNYTRDTMIAAFAEPSMTSFVMWGFADGLATAPHSILYDDKWQLKPAGKVYQDLVYNKWWTRDAKATTNAEGKATINGFYGDYDVEVTANGKTVKTMVAFHKGYDNVLEVTVK